MMPKSSAMYLPWFGAVDGDEDVARVHVGVEEAVAEHLREEDLDAGARQPLDVDAGLAQAVDLADRDAVHALHDHHVACRSSPNTPRARAAAASAAKLRRSCEQLAASRIRSSSSCERLVELGDDLARLQALAVGPELLHQHRAGVHQREVLVDHLGDVGPQHLDRDRRAVGQHGEMHLRDRRAGDRRRDRTT